MTPDERQLISGLFDRMSANGRVEKDREAESLINQAVRQTPDAAYLLVQSVLAQEHYLQQAAQRIEELEAQVRDMEDELARSAQSQQRAPAGGGSFLGGLFGGSKPSAPEPEPYRPRAAAAGSVPSFGGGRPQAASARAGSPWGQQQPQGGGGFGQGGGAFGQQQPAAQAGGGGFMRSALTTAAGVAGGMLAANAISGMLKGDSSASAATPPAGADTASADAERQAQLNAQQDAQQDEELANEQHASYDDGGDSDWGSSDDSEF
jgi:hypothetical protein